MKQIQEFEDVLKKQQEAKFRGFMKMECCDKEASNKTVCKGAHFF